MARPGLRPRYKRGLHCPASKFMLRASSAALTARLAQDRLDGFAVARRLSDVDRDQVAGVDPAANLHRLAVIVTERHLGQLQQIVANDRYENLTVAENERIVGHTRHAGRHSDRKFHPRIYPWIEQQI